MFNLYNLSFIASLLILSIGAGVVFAWTRSIVPSVVAHAIINFPMTPSWQGVVLIMFIIGAVVTARRGALVVKQVFSRASIIACIALAVMGAGYAIAAPRVKYLDFAAVGMVVLAVGFEAMERRRTEVSTNVP